MKLRNLDSFDQAMLVAGILFALLILAAVLQERSRVQTYAIREQQMAESCKRPVLKNMSTTSYRYTCEGGVTAEFNEPIDEILKRNRQP